MKTCLIILSIGALAVGLVAANPTGGHSHKLSATKLISFLSKACNDTFMTPEKTEELLACSSNQNVSPEFKSKI